MLIVEIVLAAFVLLIVLGCFLDIYLTRNERDVRRRVSAATRGDITLDAPDRLALRGFLRKLRRP
jgi:hypothetical protein